MPADQDGYRVDARDAREVGPFTDYVERGDGDRRGYVEFNCPSCEHSIPADELVKEGGTECPGCERTVRLHITSHDLYGKWRNIPKGKEEAYR